jgi:hypothetical protein
MWCLPVAAWAAEMASSRFGASFRYCSMSLCFVEAQAFTRFDPRKLRQPAKQEELPMIEQPPNKLFVADMQHHKVTARHMPYAGQRKR